MNKSYSIFGQLLQLFPQVEFQQAQKETEAHRHARGFTYLCGNQYECPEDLNLDSIAEPAVFP
jgi:hypothetical protein